MTKRVFLRPAEIIITPEPTIVTTILGSCVAITLYAPGLHLGGMCHTMLPYGNTDTDNGFRYVDIALHHMITAFRETGLRNTEMEAKLIGGGDVLDRISTSSPSVGRQNIAAAMDILNNERIRLVASHVGGEMGRKIHFHTHSGKILLSMVKRLSDKIISGDHERPS